MARRAALEEKFVTNRERFEQISRILSDESVGALERFRAISEKVDAVELCRSIAESGFKITIVLDAMRLASKVLLTCEPNLEPELRSAAERVAAAAQSQDSYDVLHALQGLHEAGKQKATADPTSPWGVTFRLVDVGWDYVFWNYYSLRKRKESGEPTSGR
jgi:hypothetical protein